MDINLDTLKREIFEYLDAEKFFVFRGYMGELESLPVIRWDSQTYPDYQMFLAAAKQLSVKLIVFSHAHFDSSDIDDTIDQLEECDFSREERHELERRLSEMRIFEGMTSGLELAFDYQGRIYLYEVTSDWFDEYVTVCDEISARLPLEEEEESDGNGSLGGYFSKN